MGYYLAGFRVIGIDIKDQPRYPFEFIKMDALEFLDRYIAGEFERAQAFHASPPCQHASTIAKQQRQRRPGKYSHPNLIPPTRGRLVRTGKPYVIENVIGAELVTPVEVCGSWFGLNVRRHRLFESNLALMGTPCCHYWQKPRFRSLDKRHSGLAGVVGVHGHINYRGEKIIREHAMGIDWMESDELTQAIPPAYTEFIGKQLMQFLERERE